MTREIPIYQIDAFTSRVFAGNPAAVCPLETWLPDDVLQGIAAENNLAETAYLIVRDDGDYDLRWFTPAVEVDLCGHATLASAYVIDKELEPGRGHVQLIAELADEYDLVDANGRKPRIDDFTRELRDKIDRIEAALGW